MVGEGYLKAYPSYPSSKGDRGDPNIDRWNRRNLEGFSQRLKNNPGLGYRVIGIIAEKKSTGNLEGFKILGILVKI